MSTHPARYQTHSTKSPHASTWPNVTPGRTNAVPPPGYYHPQVPRQTQSAAPFYQAPLSHVPSRPPAGYQSAYQPPPGYVPSKVLPPPELPRLIRTEPAPAPAPAPARPRQSRPRRQQDRDKRDRKDTRAAKDTRRPRKPKDTGRTDGAKGQEGSKDKKGKKDDFVELGLELVNKMAEIV